MKTTILRVLSVGIATAALLLSTTNAHAASGRARLYDASSGALVKEWKNPGAHLCKSFYTRVPFFLNLTDATIRVYTNTACTGAYWVFPPGDSGTFNTGFPRAFKPLS